MRKSVKIKKTTGWLLVLILLCTGTAGCSNLQDFQVESLTGKEETDEFTSLGLLPEFDYEVPESLPNILVDQVGYAIGSKKVAMINGETPRKPFHFWMRRQAGKFTQARWKVKGMILP